MASDAQQLENLKMAVDLALTWTESDPDVTTVHQDADDLAAYYQSGDVNHEAKVKNGMQSLVVALALELAELKGSSPHDVIADVRRGLDSTTDE